APGLGPATRLFVARSPPAGVAGEACVGGVAPGRASPWAVQPPKTPDGMPWHALPPTLANPPAPQVEAVGCMDAAQTPLQPPGARAPSGLCALGGACGAVVLASPSMAATRLQPTGSTAASWPSASSLGASSATTSRPGPRCRPAACGPCPKYPFSSGVRWSRATSQSPRAQLATAPRLPWTSDGSSRPAARDARYATDWRGAAARNGPPPASDGPRWPRPLPGPRLGRFGPDLPGRFSAISPGTAWLAQGPVWLGADARRCKANSSWPGHDRGETNPGCSGNSARCAPA